MTHEEATVPQDESPEHACDYCGHPFPTTDRLALHRGLEHPAHLDEDEEDAFVSARSNEQDQLRTLRIKALGGLVILYFGFLILYGILT